MNGNGKYMEGNCNGIIYHDRSQVTFARHKFHIVIHRWPSHFTGRNNSELLLYEPRDTQTALRNLVHPSCAGCCVINTFSLREDWASNKHIVLWPTGDSYWNQRGIVLSWRLPGQTEKTKRFQPRQLISTQRLELGTSKMQVRAAKYSPATFDHWSLKNAIKSIKNLHI
jgi:hypothetical protein